MVVGTVRHAHVRFKVTNRYERNPPDDDVFRMTRTGTRRIVGVAPRTKERSAAG